MRRDTEIFSGAFKHSAIGMAIVSPKGKWLRVNDALVRLLGYTREELLKLNFQKITHPEDLEKDLEIMSGLIKKEVATHQVEKRYLHKNGEIIYVLLTVSPVWKSDNNIDYFISQIVDITATKKLIAELSEKNTALALASEELELKNKQLQELQHMIGHDVRGPIRTITALIDLAEHNPKEEAVTTLPLIKEISLSVEEVISGLLNIAELQLGQGLTFEGCDIHAMSEHILHSLKVPSANVIINYNLSVPFVRFPKLIMHSILYNLVSNAIKYRKKDAACIIDFSSYILDNKTVIQIKDNGVGFDSKSNSESLFKPGKTFHLGYDSKGFGLYLIKNQIEKFGGTVSVESEEGSGTIFTITLQK